MEEFIEIVSGVLRIDPSLVNGALRRDQVEAWDSLGHLRIIAEFEEHFGISVPIEDFPKIQTVGDLEAYLR